MTRTFGTKCINPVFFHSLSKCCLAKTGSLCPEIIDDWRVDRQEFSLRGKTRPFSWKSWTNNCHCKWISAGFALIAFNWDENPVETATIYLIIYFTSCGSFAPSGKVNKTGYNVYIITVYYIVKVSVDLGCNFSGTHCVYSVSII